jgi:hypothetical protein
VGVSTCSTSTGSQPAKGYALEMQTAPSCSSSLSLACNLSIMGGMPYTSTTSAADRSASQNELQINVAAG